MLWIKSFHIVAMVAWFAGLFYLPRLFVYHVETLDELSLTRFKIMERRLYYGIMWPAGLMTTILGLWLLMKYMPYTAHAGWMHAKLALVVLLWAYHLRCGAYRRQLVKGRYPHGSLFYRVWNEVPTILLIAIVVLVVLKPHHTSKLQLKEASFDVLPDWGKTDILPAFKALNVSCGVFLRQNPNQSVGSESYPLKAKDWYPACQAAKALHHPSPENVRLFFEHWFHPVEFDDGKPVQGLFTGYYLPAVSGNLTQSSLYPVPIYGVPKDLVRVHLPNFSSNLPNRNIVGRVVDGYLQPYYTRKAINQGAIEKQAPVLAWVKSPMDRLVLEIEGSGLVLLPDGKRLFLNYAAENGAPYTAIAHVLIQQGIMTRDTASMQRIQAYLETHADQMDAVLNQNESFVFFKTMNQEGALGSQGVLLEPGYSLAVDRAWVPIGTPIWLQTEQPDLTTNDSHPFTRLMIAQDTGGAIRGPVRGDVFWGNGDEASQYAGKMRNQGRYWLLLPNTTSIHK